jgi:hypothetical protein
MHEHDAQFLRNLGREFNVSQQALLNTAICSSHLAAAASCRLSPAAVENHGAVHAPPIGQELSIEDANHLAAATTRFALTQRSNGTTE